MSLVHNERVKLSATALNNTAIATVVTGLIAPAASFARGLSTGPSGHLWWLVASAWVEQRRFDTLCGQGYAQGAKTMTAIEAYLIFAPLTLAALAWGFALWTIRH